MERMTSQSIFSRSCLYKGEAKSGFGAAWCTPTTAHIMTIATHVRDMVQKSLTDKFQHRQHQTIVEDVSRTAP